uniref:Uncharacterized protein n=1 Tax=Hucho hucho TaxID=62062 RepID=A0A4W5NJA8_9TELE
MRTNTLGCIYDVLFSRNEGFILPDEMSVMFTKSSGNTSVQKLAIEPKKQIEASLLLASLNNVSMRWNKCGRSTLATETVEDASDLQLLRPNPTRWNSWFMAVERLLKIVKDKREAAVRVLCTDFEVPIVCCHHEPSRKNHQHPAG